MCYHKKEVMVMDERNTQQEEQNVSYVPRPWWQVWGARIALAVFVIGLILYYCNLFGAVR